MAGNKVPSIHIVQHKPTTCTSSPTDPTANGVTTAYASSSNMVAPPLPPISQLLANVTPTTKHISVIDVRPPSATSTASPTLPQVPYPPRPHSLPTISSQQQHSPPKEDAISPDDPSKPVALVTRGVGAGGEAGGGGFYCSRCNLPFTEKAVKSGEAEKHCAAAHHNTHVFRCHLCAKIFPNSEMASDHLQRSHLHKRQAQDQQQQRHTCHLCGEVFSGRPLLKAHLQSAHGAPAAPQVGQQCTTCKRVFASRATLRRHQLTMHRTTAPPQLKCGSCSAAFGQQSALAAHAQSAHSQQEEDKGECSLCGETLGTAIEQHAANCMKGEPADKSNETKPEKS